MPETVASRGTVRVFDVVPPLMVKPFDCGVKVSVLTDMGLIFPSVRLMAGVVVWFEIVAAIPLADITDTDVTVPLVAGTALVHTEPLDVSIFPVEPGAILLGTGYQQSHQRQLR